MHLLNFGIKFSSAICLLGHLDFSKTRKSSDPTKAIGVGVSRDSARNSIFRFGSNNFGVSSPFYLMDEVDAHLDAQNTERLSKVMVERSNGSQILMVTLKESTVAKASQIFGIYPKSGASQIVHYKNPDNVHLAQIKTSE